MSYVLGIDLGTSSLKGLLVNQEGTIIATASSSYPLVHPAPGFSEQDPKLWIEAADKVILELHATVADFSDKIVGISFSGQMHSLVVLDEANEVLRNAILWNDVRTTSQCERITAEYGQALLEMTKNIALEGFTLPKILWLQENEPEVWAKVRHILLPKDYLGYWMTDTKHMDYSDAAGTLLLDLNQKVWSQDILEKFSISADLLPTLIESAGQTGVLKDELKARYNIQQTVKIFAGGADNACAAVGAGIVDSGTAMASIGTSGVFLSYENDADQDYQGKLHLFHHAKEASYYSMGVTLAAGHSLDWFKSTFAPDKTFEELLADVDTVAAGSEGLIFTPYIVGERTPHVDGQIRGTFTGIDTSHQLKHFARAVLEGITYSLKDSQTIMEAETGRHFKRIVSVGGGAKNKEWLQMQANIFNAEVTSLETEQGPGLGAAMLAAVGLGWFENYEDCTKAFVNYKESTYPEPENVLIYEDYYSIYQDVYAATKDINHRLRNIDRGE